MNISSAPITESHISDSVTMAAAITSSRTLPVPVPDWYRARPVWGACWPAHVYGFACAFLLAATLSASCTPYCFRCRRSPRSTVATSAVSAIVGVICLAQSSVLLIDAYHSTGRLPIALVQLVHGLVLPGIVSTLTILDRIFSALVKPRQQPGSIKHPRLITTALSVYLLATSATYLVISSRPQTRLWLLVCHVVSLTWGCAAVFLVVCQCFRLARYSRLTARSRRQTAAYIRAKRHVDQCMDDPTRRYELLRHLSRLRVARTKADEFATDERQAFTDVDVHVQTSTSDSSDDQQLASDLEVTKTTTTLKLSHKLFQYRRRSRRRRHVTGSSMAAGSEAVRDFTVTALAAARLLWSDSDACCDESPTRTWHVSLQPTDRRRRRKLNDRTPGNCRQHCSTAGQHTSVTATDSGHDDVDNDVEKETESSSSEDRQQQHPQTSNNDQPPVPEHNITDGGVESEETNAASRYRDGRQLELGGTARDISRRQLGSSLDASSRTHLLLQDGAGVADSSSAAGPRLGLSRLLRHWRESWRVTSRSADAEVGQRIACVAESHLLNASAHLTTASRHNEPDDWGRTKSSSTERRPHDIVLFENRAYDHRDDVTGYDDVTACNDVAEPDTSAQNIAAVASEEDDYRQVSTAGYVADTEHDNSVDCKHYSDLELSATTFSLPLPAHSFYLGLNRLRSGRTVRLVWRTASALVTSASVVCCLHIYSMLGVFGVLSNDRPASVWPWLAFQTLYRYRQHLFLFD